MDTDKEMILIERGIDPEDMEYLLYAERVEVLEAAGLDPADFDF